LKSCGGSAGGWRGKSDPNGAAGGERASGMVFGPLCASGPDRGGSTGDGRGEAAGGGGSGCAGDCFGLGGGGIPYPLRGFWSDVCAMGFGGGGGIPKPPRGAGAASMPAVCDAGRSG
jgi:hypothetical protein